MAELSVHSSDEEAANGSKAANGSSDADKEASDGQDSEKRSSGEGSEGGQLEGDAPARCMLYFCTPLFFVMFVLLEVSYLTPFAVMRIQGGEDAHHEGQHKESCQEGESTLLTLSAEIEPKKKLDGNMCCTICHMAIMDRHACSAVNAHRVGGTPGAMLYGCRHEVLLLTR